MRRRSVLILLALGVAAAAWGEPVILTAAEFNRLALADWAAVDKTNISDLDSFIDKFPYSELAAAAFVTRYRLVRASGDLAAHHSFIDRYPDRVLTAVAVGDAFRLYSEQDRVSGFLDFISRYPNTPEALVSRVKIAHHLFQFIAIVESEDYYDDFIDLNADSAYAVLAMKRATQLRVESERAMLDGGQVPNPTVRVRRLTKEYVNLMSPLLGTASERDVRKAGRIATVVRFVYGDDERADLIEAQPAVLQFEEHRVGLKIEQKLGEILTKLTDNQQRTEELFRSEFGRTRDEVKSALDGLAQNTAELSRIASAGFEKIDKTMNASVAELRLANATLTEMKGTLADIRAGIKRSNDALERIEANVVSMRAEVRDVAFGIGTLGRKIDASQREQLNALSGLTATVKSGIDAQIASSTTVLAKLEVMTQQDAAIAAQTLSQLRTVNSGLETLDRTVVGGFRQIDASMTAQRQAAEQAKSRAGGIGSLLGSIAGSFIPGVGPIIGPLLGGLADSVIRGDDPGDALASTAVAALGAAVPGSQEFAKPILDYARGERGRALESARAMLPSIRDKAVDYAADYIL